MTPVLTLLMLTMASVSPKLQEARTLADEFQYDKAIKAIEAGLQLPDLDRESLVGFYELAGISWATLDKPAKAREAFELLLSVAPEHQLSKNFPPRIRTPYFEARGGLAKLGPVTLTAEPAQKANGKVTGLVLVAHDNELVRARAVRFTLKVDDRDDSQLVTLDEAHKAHLPVDGRSVKWTAELLGERNAVLEVLSGLDEVKPVDLPPPPPPPVVTATPTSNVGALRTGGFVAGGVGLAALIAGSIFGWSSSDARSRITNAARDSSGVVTGLTQRDAAALEASAKTNAVVANTLFIAGGVLAATGVVLVIVGAPGPNAPVALGVSPGGVSVSGRF